MSLIRYVVLSLILVKLSVIAGFKASHQVLGELLSGLPGVERAGCESQVFSRKLNGPQTYLCGESFAGQYIPYFGKLAS